MRSSTPSPFTSPAELTEWPERSYASIPVSTKPLLPSPTPDGYKVPSEKVGGNAAPSASGVTAARLAAATTACNRARRAHSARRTPSRNGLLGLIGAIECCKALHLL